MPKILGNIGSITDPTALKAIKRLEEELSRLDARLSTVTRNNTVNLLNHDEFNKLDYASAGHTGFASSAQLTAHTGDAGDPHTQYLTEASASGLYAVSGNYEVSGTMVTHVAEGDPHSQYVLDAGDTMTGRLYANLGITVSGTAAAGAFLSDVPDTGDPNDPAFVFQPNNEFGSNQPVFQLKTYAGDPALSMNDAGTIQFNSFSTEGDAVLSVAGTSDKSYGLKFEPNFTSDGSVVVGSSYPIFCPTEWGATYNQATSYILQGGSTASSGMIGMNMFVDVGGSHNPATERIVGIRTNINLPHMPNETVDGIASIWVEGVNANQTGLQVPIAEDIYGIYLRAGNYDGRLVGGKAGSSGGVKRYYQTYVEKLLQTDPANVREMTAETFYEGSGLIAFRDTWNEQSDGFAVSGVGIRSDDPGSLDLYSSSVIKLHNLPTSDPAIANALWNDSGTLKVSAG